MTTPGTRSGGADRVSSRSGTYPAAAIPALETERLLLRGFRDADREPFAALNGDPEVMRYFVRTLDRAASDERVDRILGQWRIHGYGLWAVERRSDGVFLGFTGLAKQDYLEQPEVGWRFARFAWGHGFATEAALAALDWGFDALAVPEIVSVTAVANERSRAVMERLGMHRDPADDFLHPHIPDGNPLRAHVMYRLRREEWLARGSDPRPGRTVARGT